MPEPRSSSAVRNLRSLFENKAAAIDLDDSQSRGRSPSSRLSLSDPAQRPLSRIRASFVDVVHNPPRTISNHSSPAMSTSNDSPSAASNNSPPSMSTNSPPTLPAAAHAKRASAFEVRTESFSTADLSKDAVSALKQEVAEEKVRRQSNPDLFATELEDEAAVESTVNTPAVEPREDQAMGVIDHAAAKLTAADLPPPNEEEEIKQAEVQSAEETADEKKAVDENEPPANPDKPTTGAEEEQGALKPAMPVNEDAVSGGQGLPSAAEDLRPQNKAAETTPKKTEKAEQTQQATATPKSVSEIKSTPQKRPPMSPRNSHRPDPVSTGSPQKASEGSLKSPSALKSPKERKSSSSSKATLSPTGTPKPSVARKASRSSLVAPTAASSARERRESTVKPSAPAVKRETTKPANLPSHLTAPTAASRARQEAESSKPSTGRPSVSARAPPKQQISTSKPAARSSTATRPESRSTQQSAPRKSNTTAAPSESFLERMMRPTAASASKTHDKPAEPKALPQRTKSSAAKPKTNGTAKPAAKSGAASKSLHPTKSTEEKPEVIAAAAGKEVEEKTETNGKAEETEMPDIPIPAAENGTSTPQHGAENGQATGAALESTPGFGEDQIR